MKKVFIPLALIFSILIVGFIVGNEIHAPSKRKGGWVSPWRSHEKKRIGCGVKRKIQCFTIDATERVFVFTDTSGTTYYTNNAHLEGCSQSVVDSILDSRKTSDTTEHEAALTAKKEG